MSLNQRRWKTLQCLFYTHLLLLPSMVYRRIYLGIPILVPHSPPSQYIPFMDRVYHLEKPFGHFGLSNIVYKICLAHTLVLGTSRTLLSIDSLLSLVPPWY